MTAKEIKWTEFKKIVKPLTNADLKWDTMEKLKGVLRIELLSEPDLCLMSKTRQNRTINRIAKEIYNIFN